MSIDVFDAHHDLRNVFVSPQVRCRFLRMAPGEQAARHSHDLGVEIFLVLEGCARVEIDGDVAELESGQLCVVPADAPHQVTAVGDEPLTLYLSVTPHVQPTHTIRDTEDRPPPRFLPGTSYDVEEKTRLPVEEVIDHFVDLAEELSAVTRTAAEEQRMAGARLGRALGARNLDAADRQREIMWFGMYRVFDKLFEMTALWNHLAPRAGRVG